MRSRWGLRDDVGLLLLLRELEGGSIYKPFGFVVLLFIVGGSSTRQESKEETTRHAQKEPISKEKRKDPKDNGFTTG